MKNKKPSDDGSGWGHKLIYKKLFESIGKELTITFDLDAYYNEYAKNGNMTREEYSWNAPVTQLEAASIWPEYRDFKRIVMTDIASKAQISIMDAMCGPDSVVRITFYNGDDKPFDGGRFHVSLANELLPLFTTNENVVTRVVPCPRK